MTEEELKAIRKRCEEATEGPWTIEGSSEWAIESPSGSIGMLGGNTNLVYNGEFISHARTDIPKLLDEIERLKQWNGELMALEPKRIKTLLSKEWAEKDRLKDERAIDLAFLQEAHRRLSEATHILLFYSDAENYPHEVNKDGGAKARKLLEEK